MKISIFSAPPKNTIFKVLEMSFDLLFNVVWLLKRDLNTWLENIVRTSVCLRYSEEKSELRVIQVSRELSDVSFNQLIPRLFHVKILNKEPFAILYASSY